MSIGARKVELQTKASAKPLFNFIVLGRFRSVLVLVHSIVSILYAYYSISIIKTDEASVYIREMTTATLVPASIEKQFTRGMLTLAQCQHWHREQRLPLLFLFFCTLIFDDDSEEEVSQYHRENL